MSNPVVKWQIVAPDVEAVTSFCSKLFGWKVDASNSLGYRELQSKASRGIDGGVWPAPTAGMEPKVQLFVEVDDVDASLTRAKSLGATVLVPRTALPDGDVMGIILDDSGLTWGLVQRR